MREAADQGGAVERLELVELAAVDDPGDDFVDIVGRADVVGHDCVEFLGVVLRRARFLQRQAVRMHRAKVADDIAHDRQRVFVVLGEVIGDAGLVRMEIAAAQLLGA